MTIATSSFRRQFELSPSAAKAPLEPVHSVAPGAKVVRIWPVASVQPDQQLSSAFRAVTAAPARPPAAQRQHTSWHARAVSRRPATSRPLPNLRPVHSRVGRLRHGRVLRNGSYAAGNPLPGHRSPSPVAHAVSGNARITRRATVRSAMPQEPIEPAVRRSRIPHRASSVRSLLSANSLVLAHARVGLTNDIAQREPRVRFDAGHADAKGKVGTPCCHVVTKQQLRQSA